MPYLEYEEQGSRKTLNLAYDKETFIGRDPQCTIPLDHIPQASRRHCVIYFNTNLNSFAVADLHSTNGTKLNGIRISLNDITLNNHDTIQIGAAVFTFHDDPLSGGESGIDIDAMDPLNVDPQSYVNLVSDAGPDAGDYSKDLLPGMKIDSFTVAAILETCDEYVHYLLDKEGTSEQFTMKIYKTQQKNPVVAAEFAMLIGSLQEQILPKGMLPYSGGGIRDAEYCYYTTEFREYPSLATLISARAPIEEKKCLPIIYSIVEILDRCTEAKLFHGNLKPSQILYSQKGSCITGFGLAAWLRAHSRSNYRQTPLWYASPEFISGEELNSKSDMYSLGIIFFQMLTGVLPFRSNFPAELAKMHMETPLPFPAERNEKAEITKITDGLLRRMTMKHPKNRCNSWKDVLYQLKRANKLLN